MSTFEQAFLIAWAALAALSCLALLVAWGLHRIFETDVEPNARLIVYHDDDAAR